MNLFHLTRELRPYSLGLAFSLLLSHIVYFVSPILVLSVLGPRYAWVDSILRSSVCEPRKTDLWTWGNCEVQFPGSWLNNKGKKIMIRAFRCSNRIGTKVKPNAASAIQEVCRSLRRLNWHHWCWLFLDLTAMVLLQFIIKGIMEFSQLLQCSCSSLGIGALEGRAASLLVIFL